MADSDETIERLSLEKKAKLSVLAVFCFLLKKKCGVIKDRNSDGLHSDNIAGFLVSNYPGDDLDKLLELLKPFNIGTVYADNNFAYESRITDKTLINGKKNTQKIERNHLTLRTRIKRLSRRTICFSKDKDIHESVIGTFINIFFFGRSFDYSTVL